MAAQGTLHEKIELAQEVTTFMGVLAQVAELLEGSSEPALAPLAPWMSELKLTLNVATSSFANTFDDLLPGDNTNMHEDGKGLEKELERRLETKADVNATIQALLQNFSMEVANGADHEEEEEVCNDMPEKTKKWHGFKTGREYREWRKKHTQAAPALRHLFDVYEQMNNGGNHETFHGKIVSLADKLHKQNGFMARRKLQSAATKTQQCDLLVSCAKGMSTYDLIFYHFSDYIDTNTGEFAQVCSRWETFVVTVCGHSHP